MIDAEFNVTIAPRSQGWLARVDWTLHLHDDQLGEGAVTFSAGSEQFDLEAGL